MDITATDKYVKFGSKRIPKGTASYTPYVGGYVLMHLTITGESPFSVRIEGNTINGAPITELSELTDFLDANLFKSGGGDGTVGVADITGLESGNLIFGGASGNEQRKILPSDLGLFAALSLPVRSGSGGVDAFTDITLQQNPIGNSAVRRAPGGQGKFASAVNDDEAITLAQFKGIVNDSLTNAETSASLQALYESAVVGTVVTSATALTEYRKISPTQWSKSTIEIV